MNSLQNDFLKRSSAALKNLAERAENSKILTREFLRDAFRTIHTIKGTSQTFGFSDSAIIAHKIENLLSNVTGKDSFSNKAFKTKLIDAFKVLGDSFTSCEVMKNRKFLFEETEITEKTNTFLPFEAEFLNQFAEHERLMIAEEVKSGKNIYFVNSDFDPVKFVTEFKKLREKLSEKCELIATLPNQNAAKSGKIGFRICVATFENESKLSEITKEFSAEIVCQKPLLPNDSDEMLAQIVRHAKEIAEKSEKEIIFEISKEKNPISKNNQNLIFEILLHLVRNAVDHGIESKKERLAKGKNQTAVITISLKRSKNELKLEVKDDGKGIDTEKIKVKAIKNKLISPHKTLTESEMIDLIFLHDFSTAESLTEISGRGVGLDAVKKLVENAKGSINVKSQREIGTTFEVLLRYEI